MNVEEGGGEECGEETEEISKKPQRERENRVPRTSARNVGWSSPRSLYLVSPLTSVIAAMRAEVCIHCMWFSFRAHILLPIVG